MSEKRSVFAPVSHFARVVGYTSAGVRSLAKARKAGGGKVPHDIVDREMAKWGRLMCEQVNTEITLSGEPISDEPVIFVGNHTSYTDIPAVMSLTPTNFVSKSEVGKWPIFGAALKSVDTVLVKREKASSRRDAAKAIADNIKHVGRSIAVFPGGTTSIEERKAWRRGVFEIAKMEGIKIQPFTISYNPPRVAAYIDQDMFMTHIARLMREQKVECQVEFGPVVKVEDSHRDCLRVYHWVRRKHLLRLKNWGYKLSEDACNFLLEPAVDLAGLRVDLSSATKPSLSEASPD